MNAMSFAPAAMFFVAAALMLSGARKTDDPQRARLSRFAGGLALVAGIVLLAIGLGNLTGAL